MADQDRFAQSLLSIARGLGRIARERAREGEVTPQQAETLQLVAERGSISTSALATLLGIDPSTASRNLSGLERAGFIARQKGSADGRQTDVRLTARGRKAAATVSKGATSAFSAIFDELPRGERSKLVDALERVAGFIDFSG